jgi:hypothetical protein
LKITSSDYYNQEDFIMVQMRIVRFANGLEAHHLVSEGVNTIGAPMNASIMNVSFTIAARSEVINFMKKNFPTDGKIVSEMYYCDLPFQHNFHLFMYCKPVGEKHTDMTVLLGGRQIHNGRVNIPISRIKALQDKALEYGQSFLKSSAGARA